jgi:GTP1/Obg family GTP-binding protein
MAELIMGPHSQIRKILDDVCAAYGRIREITENLMNDFSVEALQETVSERSEMLLGIASGETALREISAPEELLAFEEYRDIKNHIAEITALDRELVTRVASRMNDVRQELSNLSHSSRAAMQYARA